MKLTEKILTGWNFFINRNIGRKFVVHTLPVICGIMILVALVVSRMYSEDLIGAIEERTQYSVEMTRINMDNYIDGIKQPLNILSSHASVKALLSMDMEDPDYADYLENERTMVEVINSVIMSDSMIVDVTIAGLNGYQYDMLSALREDIVDTEWFEKYVDRDETGFQYILPHHLEYYYEGRGPAQDYAVSVLLAVKNHGEITGYVIAEIDIARILDQPEAAEESENFKTYLVDEDREYFYDVSEGKINLCEDQPFLELLTDRGILTETVGNDFYTVSCLDSSGWYIVSSYLYEDILSSVRRIQRTVMILMAVGCAAIYAVSRRTTALIRKPVDDILKRMEDVEKGNFEAVAQDYRNQPGEVVLIRDKLEGMVSQLDELINKIYMDEIYQKKMEYEQLVNQINPHFLYNVLQMIQSRAILSGNEEINDIVVALSRLMRYNMSRQGKMVTIKEECDYVKSYLELYQKRYTGKFTYQIVTEPGLEAHHIIKFLIQPIVENCIKHGIKRLPRTGVIEVAVETEEDLICIRVRDNGNGIPGDKLKELRDSLENQEKENGSIGLKNTFQRIRLTYGDRAGMKIESVVNEYTEICCYIPVEENDV